MGQAQIIDEWWQQPDAGDQSMEDEHQSFWDDVIENAIDVDFTDSKIMDFGCNQGGMLRRIHESMPFREAIGVDVAQNAIQAANNRKGDLPLKYFACDTLDGFDTDFDYVVSTAVIYLIEDIAEHARQIYERLKPGGVYFATHPDYVTDSRFKVAQDVINEHATIQCAQNDLDDIIAGFEKAGFFVYVKRMIPNGYIPEPISALNNRWYGTATREIDFWYGHRYTFRCVKPEE